MSLIIFIIPKLIKAAPKASNKIKQLINSNCNKVNVHKVLFEYK